MADPHPARPRAPLASDAALAIDAAALAAASAAIAAGAHHLVAMSIALPIVAGLRWLAWARLPAPTRQLAPLAELAFFVACALIGGGNDWNTVVRHRVYDYAVPSELGPPALPVWMFVYWGLVLRFVATLATWRRLDPGAALPRDRVAGRRAPAARVAVLLAVVLITRQLVYRLHDHAWASWLPFALALVVTAALLGLDRGDRRLVAAALVIGPAAEAALIHGPGLHHYHLGWLAGVPLWIVLWWALAVVVWRDLAARAIAVLARPARPTTCDAAPRAALRCRP